MTVAFSFANVNTPCTVRFIMLSPLENFESVTLGLFDQFRHKCTENHPTRNDSDVDQQTQQSGADLYNVLLFMDHPEMEEFTMSGTAIKETLPTLLKRMPSLTWRWMVIYHRNTIAIKE